MYVQYFRDENKFAFRAGVKVTESLLAGGNQVEGLLQGAALGHDLVL